MATEQEEIIKKLEDLENKEDKNSLFLRFSYLIELQDEERLNEFLNQYKETIYHLDPIATIGYHLDFYLHEDNATEALMVLNDYQEMPYISMDVEDFMKELKEKIISTMPKAKPVITKEEIEKGLFSDSDEKVAYYIRILSQSNIRQYLGVISNFLTSKQAYKLKLLMLFVLIEQKVNQEFVVTKGELSFKLIPSLLDLPFNDPYYLMLLKKIEAYSESPTVIDYAVELLNTAQIMCFPESILDSSDLDFLCEVFIEVSRKKLHMEEYHPSQVYLNYNVSEEAYQKLFSYIEELINGNC